MGKLKSYLTQFAEDEGGVIDLDEDHYQVRPQKRKYIPNA